MVTTFALRQRYGFKSFLQVSTGDVTYVLRESTAHGWRILKYSSPNQELRSASVRNTKPLLSAATAGPTTP